MHKLTLKSKLVTGQQGYLLVEVLITVGILAVGLLGISAMQLTSLKSSYSAVQRGEAAYLIAAMSDSMRANPLGVEEGFYHALTAIDPNPDTSAPKTTPQQIAVYDLESWQQSINQTFAFDDAADAPVGSIDCRTTYNCILEINWLDTRADSSLQDSSSKRYKHIASVVF